MMQWNISMKNMKIVFLWWHLMISNGPKKHLKQENNQIYFSEQNPTFSLMTDQSPIYKPVMDDDISKAVYDFVLITSCNHTVISRGTYSMWMGLLSPGEIYTEYGAVIPST